jgi:hypothetical protein
MDSRLRGNDRVGGCTLVARTWRSGMRGTAVVLMFYQGWIPASAGMTE